MRFALALIATTGVAHAGPLPYEYQDAGACKIVVTDNAKKVARTEEFSRDAAKRIEWERLTSSGITIVTSYVYDKAGRLISASMEGDHTVFEYDDKTDRLVKTAAYESPSSKTVTWVWTFAYDDKGRQVQTTVTKDGKAEAEKKYAYDDKGRLATITSDDGLVEKHSYDKAGQLIRRDEVAAGKTVSFTYSYDAKKRLVKQTGSNGWRHDYSYDCKPTR